MRHIKYILLSVIVSLASLDAKAAGPATRPSLGTFGGINTGSIQYNGLIAWFPIWEAQGQPIVDLILGLRGEIYSAAPTVASDAEFGNHAVGGGNGFGGGTNRAYLVPHDARIDMGGLLQPGVPWAVSLWFRTLITNNPGSDSVLLSFCN